MKVAERDENRLVLKDSQLDKKLGIGIASAILLFMAYQFASGGTRDDFLIALVPLALVAGMAFYLWKTLLTSVFTFDKTTDSVTLVVTSRKGRETWDWKLSDIASTEVSEVRSTPDSQSAVQNTNKQPVFVLKDGTKVPMRPYHSAGSQSWEAIEAIRKFMGDPRRDDFPVGWIHVDDD